MKGGENKVKAKLLTKQEKFMQENVWTLGNIFIHRDFDSLLIWTMIRKETTGRSTDYFELEGRAEILDDVLILHHPTFHGPSQLTDEEVEKLTKVDRRKTPYWWRTDYGVILWKNRPPQIV